MKARLGSYEQLMDHVTQLVEELKMTLGMISMTDEKIEEEEEEIPEVQEEAPQQPGPDAIAAPMPSDAPPPSSSRA